MKYTNNQNLPEALYQAIAKDPYEKGGDFSASELPVPPQIRTLRKRYNDQLEVDVADLIYPLVGNNTHYILERSGVKNSLIEEQLFSFVDDVKVSGRPDLFDDQKILWDYKVTTRYTDAVKPDWAAQTNINAWLLETHRFTVNHIKICCIFRDWSKIQAIKNPDYPKHQVVVLPVLKWESEDTYEYIRDRIWMHQHAELQDDDQLPECSADERWEKPTIYAVMKKGRKSSLRNLYTLEDAEKYIEDNNLDTNIHSIQTRIGESTRCEYYCDVKDFCVQYKQLNFDLPF